MTTLPNLPTAYKAFLEQHDGEAYYLFDDIDGWRFYTIEELTEVIRVNRDKVLTIHQLTAFASSIREYIGDETEDQDGEPYSLDRLAAGLAIGDSNGDVVFLDPADEYSVWLWHHDGADVERLADSFEQWLEMATLSEDDEDSDGDEVK
jgi:SMI1 / KNR4 family (SUKH-1)